MVLFMIAVKMNKICSIFVNGCAYMQIRSFAIIASLCRLHGSERADHAVLGSLG